LAAARGHGNGSLTSGLGPTAAAHLFGARHRVKMGHDSVGWCGNWRAASMVGKRENMGVWSSFIPRCDEGQRNSTRIPFGIDRRKESNP
jgi:hypothetical protein